MIGELRHVAGRLGWYLREVSGESDYERWVAHQREHHPHEEPMDRRAFERFRMDDRDRNPRARCC